MKLLHLGRPDKLHHLEIFTNETTTKLVWQNHQEQARPPKKVPLQSVLTPCEFAVAFQNHCCYTVCLAKRSLAGLPVRKDKPCNCQARKVQYGSWLGNHSYRPLPGTYEHPYTIQLEFFRVCWMGLIVKVAPCGACTPAACRTECPNLPHDSNEPRHGPSVSTSWRLCPPGWSNEGVPHASPLEERFWPRISSHLKRFDKSFMTSQNRRKPLIFCNNLVTLFKALFQHFVHNTGAGQVNIIQ